MKNPLKVLTYTKYVTGKRWPEAEPYLLKNIWATIRYFKFFISEFKGGRWPEAEPYILKDSEYAYEYACVIEDRWPEAERYIMKDPHYWAQYKEEFGIDDE